MRDQEGDGPGRHREVDVRQLIREASSRVSVQHLVRKGRRSLQLMSRRLLESLIDQEVRRVARKYAARAVGAEAERIERESKRAIEALLRTPHGPIEPEPPDAAEADGELYEIPDPLPPVKSFDGLHLEPGRGLDLGTVNARAAALRSGDGEIVQAMQRNVFLELRLDAFARKLLPKFNVDCAVRGERGYLLGDAAFELAHLFERETRSPMKDGAVSPGEPDGLRVISILLDHLLGSARSEGEICCFTLPGESVDPERNFIYHRGALENVLRGLGYAPRPMPAGHAVAVAELKEQDYTGIALSCGAGLFDVCVVYKGVPALSFSTPRGGDWIDLHAARALGAPPGQVRVAKEGGMDLHAPKDRTEVAIAMYARSLLRDTLETIRRRFNEAERVPTFTQAVDLVVAGGTAQIGGFLPLLQEEFDKLDFPVPVAQIRLARDPLSAAVEGCLQAAAAETRALSEAPFQVAPAALDRAAIGALRPADREAFRRLRGA